MKKLFAVLVPILALAGCSSPLEPSSDTVSLKAARAKLALQVAAKSDERSDRSDRIAAN